jgi:RNA polymerase sigma-70 factor (ECF subfamily)
MRCLAALPPEQREVIVLKFWHHHTFEEIGELLGLSPNTAAGRYRYGLQKIRHCLTSVSHEADITESAFELDPEVSLSGAATSPVQ